MNRIFVECGHTYSSGLNTGIQRVVRNLVSILPFVVDQGVVVLPVALIKGRVCKVEDSIVIETQTRGSAFRLAKLAFYYLRKGISLFVSEQYHYFILGSSDQSGSFTNKIANLFKSKNDGNCWQEFGNISADDVLILADACWGQDIWEQVGMFKRHGGHVLILAYDLIPITHTHLCNSTFAKVFKNWIDTSLEVVDGYIAISKFVQNEFETYAKSRQSPLRRDLFFSSFYLGADFSESEKMESSEKLDPIFTKKSTVFITVCTIEPRKNHKQILDAADFLWAQGHDFIILFIGKIGWDIADILIRIQSHKEYGSRLFLVSGLSDQEVSYAYQNASVLIFPSIIEGFGLPIIEGLQRGLPVLASNTPIHKEVGGDLVKYFDLYDAHDLASSMLEMMSDSKKDMSRNALVSRVFMTQRWFSQKLDQHL